jgi:hypothetical protein
LKEWGRCYVDELAGVACDAGSRDLKVARAEDKVRSFLGGSKDRKCSGAGLTPTLLDLPDTCAAPCASIEIDTIGDWADCMICRQEAATTSMLEAAIGTVPPDLPLNLLAPDPLSCNRRVVRRVQTSARNIQKKLGACRLGNVGAVTPVDCAATLASEILTEKLRADDEFNFCANTTGMLGCRFGMGASVYCLGNTSEAIGADLVESVFETKD